MVTRHIKGRDENYSPKKTKQVVPTTAADLAEETKQVHDKTYAEACAILATLLSRQEAERRAQQLARDYDSPPIFHVPEDGTFDMGFKCYYQTPDPGSTFQYNRTLLRLLLRPDSDHYDSDGGSYSDGSDDPGSTDYFDANSVLCGLAHRPHWSSPGPSPIMNVLFICTLNTSKKSYEAAVLKSALHTFLVIFKGAARQKFLEEIGFGDEFNGSLIDKNAAGYLFWFERYSIGEIIDGLRRYGDVRAARFLEDWERGPGRELEELTKKVLEEHRLAAFSKLVNLLLRPDPDKKPPTISLDDSALDRQYSGRWWADFSDDLGFDDKVVYGPKVMFSGVLDKNQPTKKRTGRKTRSGGARQRYGRPSDSQDPTTISPPSAILYKNSPALSVGVTIHCAAEDSVAGTFLFAFSASSTPGSAASATKHDETSLMPLAPRTPHTPSLL